MQDVAGPGSVPDAASGAGGSRTHTRSPSGDFKSPASASSATAPRLTFYPDRPGVDRRRYGQIDSSVESGSQPSTSVLAEALGSQTQA